MVSTNQRTAAMALFADPEIRIGIMEQCEPATLWAIMSVSAQSFRDFKRYPKTFMAAVWSNLGCERNQAWRFLKALEAQPRYSEPCLEDAGHLRRPWGPNSTLDMFLQTALGYDDLSIPELGGPLNVLARLATVQTAINTLEKAQIWSFSKEDFEADRFNYSPLLPIREEWLSHILWDIQIFCKLFNHTTSPFPKKDTQEPSSGPSGFLRELEIIDFVDYPADFVTVYTDLFHLLERTYEQHMAETFVHTYLANIDYAYWPEDSAADLVACRRGQIKHSMMKEIRDRIDAQFLLGLPFIAEIYRIRSKPDACDTIPGLVGFSDGSISGFHYYRGRRPQECVAFELFPCSDGLAGYNLSLVLQDRTSKSLRRVDFDHRIFTNGYHPQDLGGIEEVEKKWHQQILDEGMRSFHRYIDV